MAIASPDFQTAARLMATGRSMAAMLRADRDLSARLAYAALARSRDAAGGAEVLERPAHWPGLADLTAASLAFPGWYGPVPAPLVAALARRCPRLTDLDVSGPWLDDDAQRALAQLTGLSRLTLDSDAYGETTGPILPALPHLQRLEVVSVALWVPDFLCAMDLRQLTALTLERTNIRALPKSTLGRLTRLHTLDVNSSSFVGPALLDLSALASLRELDITEQHHFAPPDLALLTQLTALRLGRLSDWRDELPAVRAMVGRLTGLVHLSLIGLNPPPRLLEPLADLPALTSLAIGTAGLTAAAIAAFARARPGVCLTVVANEGQVFE